MKTIRLSCSHALFKYLTAQKTINTLLNTKDETNILTLIDTSDLNISNIKIKNNINCMLNNS